MRSVHGQPVYRLGEVVASWERAPKRWIGRTILVGTEAARDCDVATYDQTVAIYRNWSICTPPATPVIMLTDPYQGVAIPTGSGDGSGFPLEGYIVGSYPPGATPPTPTPTPIFEVRLATRPECGRPEPGRHPCLVAEPVSWAIP